MQVQDNGNYKRLDEHGSHDRDQLIRLVLMKIERSNASRKKIRRYNSRSTTWSRMNHKAGINGHTWHSFAVVLVKVDDVPIAALLATKKFPFLSFFLSFSCFIRSCTSTPSHAEACTDETRTCSSFFRIIGCPYSRLGSSFSLKRWIFRSGTFL